MSASIRWSLGAMLLCLACSGPRPSWGQVNVDASQDEKERLGTPWFGNSAVRKQLKLDDEQYNRLNRSYGQYYSRFNQGLTGLAADLKEEQRLQRLRELNDAYYKDFAKTADEVLTDAQLRQRYNQLHWQYQAYGAFYDPRVQDSLKLTDQQRQAFGRYYNDWNRQTGMFRREYAADREGVTRRYNESWQEYRDRVNSTLTPEQRRTWSEMIGTPYNFPAEVYFGR